MSTRVLQVITDPDRRGAQVFAVDLGSYFESQGLTVETAALWPGTSKAQLDVAPLARRRGRLGFVSALRECMRLADVVIAHGSNTLMATAVASRGVSTPIVYRQISDLNFWAGAVQRRLRVRAYLRRMSHAVALWPGSARVLAERFGFPEAKISIIPNGVRSDFFSPATAAERAAARRHFGVPDGAHVALCVSALVPEKGVDLAIKAVGRLPEVTLLVAGHGPDRASLEDLGARECPGRAVFAGAIDDARLAYAAADVFLLPSRTESMPAVVIEAGMSKLPVIATRVGAIPTMVHDGKTGFLVSTDIAEMAARIRDALSEPALGAAGRAHCLATYSIESVGDAWLHTLEQQRSVSMKAVRK